MPITAARWWRRKALKWREHRLQTSTNDDVLTDENYRRREQSGRLLASELCFAYVQRAGDLSTLSGNRATHLHGAGHRLLCTYRCRGACHCSSMRVYGMLKITGLWHRVSRVSIRRQRAVKLETFLGAFSSLASLHTSPWTPRTPCSCLAFPIHSMLLDRHAHLSCMHACCENPIDHCEVWTVIKARVYTLAAYAALRLYV